MERLPGFRDFYPEPLPDRDAWSAQVRQYVFERWRAIARRYGFVEYDGPPLEPLELFTLKSGEEIVKQLFDFVDKGGRKVALRPEMTPTLARMVAAHQRNYKKPLKWFAIPQLFRYEKQQKGRLREHFQFNADIIGEAGAAADAELIALLIDTLRAFGLTEQDFVVRLSSRKVWEEFLEPKRAKLGLGPDQVEAFYQAVDKLGRDTAAESQSKLAALGLSLDEVNEFIHAARPTAELQSILENLAARGLAAYVQIDYRIVRGLAYYTGPVYEAFDRKGEFRAIAGGGRYDNLIKLVSGGKIDLPALGFGMGDVVLVELLKARGLVPKLDAGLDAFCIIEDETLRSDTLRLVQRLRNAGLAVDYPLGETKPDKQIKRAHELGAKRTVKLERAANGLLVRIRNLASREEKTGAPEQVETLVQAT
ncbi:MAG: histidine--tRNA ligase [Verrucomicrobiae bacterium]|nr:histidine--tRNA ligase [Verrucomicrobiae bacterium]